MFLKHMNELIKQNEGLLKLLGMSLVLLVLAFTVSAVVGIGNQLKEGKYIGENVKSQNTITVSGEGEVYTKPDLAKVSFSVKNEAQTVSEAMELNSERMNAVIEAVKNEGVEGKDLKTTNFNLSPRYEWRKPEEQLSISPDDGRRILVGYEVNQSLQVKIRNMDSVGDVIESATDAGANKVGNVAFTVEDQEAVKEKARKQAIDDAKKKAGKLASRLGVDLVKIVNYNEGYSSPRFYQEREMSMDATDAGGDASPNIQTGENKVNVNVNITYQIN